MTAKDLLEILKHGRLNLIRVAEGATDYKLSYEDCKILIYSTNFEGGFEDYENIYVDDPVLCQEVAHWEINLDPDGPECPTIEIILSGFVHCDGKEYDFPELRDAVKQRPL